MLLHKDLLYIIQAPDQTKVQYWHCIGLIDNLLLSKAGVVPLDLSIIILSEDSWYLPVRNRSNNCSIIMRLFILAIPWPLIAALMTWQLIDNSLLTTNQTQTCLPIKNNFWKWFNKFFTKDILKTWSSCNPLWPYQGLCQV